MKKLLLFILFFSFLNASNLQKTSVELMWLDQFEFAGFYIAKEKGFYEDAGLDVELKKFDSSMDLTKKVLDKEADFGLNSSSLLIDKAKGKDIVLLGTIFQSSPLALLALKNSNIETFSDMKNKKVMISNNQENFAPLQSMLKSQGLQPQELSFISHSFDVDDLINKKTDMMSVYVTNEPFILNEKGYEYTIFNPKNFGFNFYEDLIFTSKDFASKNPKLVKDFYNATMKGWKYAFDNIEETAQIIHEKYNTQNKSLKALIFEANEMKKLVYDKNGKFGTISQEKINLILNTYRVMGLINNQLELDDLIYTKHLEDNMLLNDNEKEYLKKKKSITMCIDPSRMPFEKIEDGKHIGIIADYINLIQNKIKTPIVLIPTKNWSESLQKVKNKECDILSFAVNSLERQEYLNFTKPFFNLPLVIASDIHTPFIEDIGKIKNQKFGIVKGYAYETILKVKYPNLQLVQVQNIEEGLQLVKKGQIFGFIDNLATVGYHIQNDYVDQLKISGKFNEIWDLGIGTRNDEPILNTIFEKVTNDISSNHLQQITNKWIPIEYQKEFDYKLLYQLLAVILVLTSIGIIFYRDYLLKKLNAQLNEKIKIEIEKNEEKNRILIQQSRMASMGEMLENIAHQWRQPLSTISVAASGMEVKKEFSSLSDKEFFEAIDHIKKSTQYLSNTIDDFRSFFSKNKKTSQIDISDTIEKSLELMGNSFLHHKINLVKSLKSIETTSLENELIQVLMNILVNAKDALRHTVSAEKYIFIDVEEKDNQIVIQVKDNAGGIDNDIIDKIFEPYFTTKHQFNGTGIGLYMSKLLMEKHLKGELTVKNVEYTFMDNNYKGALFEVILPIS
jgi:ABC-type nitrate/sulfonate/bicarbonate transport system substrate-binding protein/signal transduction histidine kinase